MPAARLIPNEPPEELPEEVQAALDEQYDLEMHDDEVDYLLETTNLTVEEAEALIEDAEGYA